MEGDNDDFLQEVMQIKKQTHRNQKRKRSIAIILQNRRQIMLDALSIRNEERQEENIEASNFEDIILQFHQILSKLELIEQDLEEQEFTQEWKQISQILQQFDRLFCQTDQNINQFAQSISLICFSANSSFQQLLETRILQNNLKEQILSYLVSIANKLILISDLRKGIMNYLLDNEEFINQIIMQLQDSISSYLIQESSKLILVIEAHWNESNDKQNNNCNLIEFIVQLLGKISQDNLLYPPLILSSCQILDSSTQQDFILIISRPNYLMEYQLQILQQKVEPAIKEAILEIILIASELLDENSFEGNIQLKLFASSMIELLQQELQTEDITTLSLKILSTLLSKYSLQEMITSLLFNKDSDLTSKEISNEIQEDHSINNHQVFERILTNCCSLKISDIANEFLLFACSLIEANKKYPWKIQQIINSGIIPIFLESLKSEFVDAEIFESISSTLLDILSLSVFCSELNQQNEEAEQCCKIVAIQIDRLGGMEVINEVMMDKKCSSQQLEVFEKIIEMIAFYNNYFN